MWVSDVICILGWLLIGFAQVLSFSLSSTLWLLVLMLKFCYKNLEKRVTTSSALTPNPMSLLQVDQRVIYNINNVILIAFGEK